MQSPCSPFSRGYIVGRVLCQDCYTFASPKQDSLLWRELYVLRLCSLFTFCILDLLSSSVDSSEMEDLKPELWPAYPLLVCVRYEYVSDTAARLWFFTTLGICYSRRNTPLLPWFPYVV